MVETPTPSPEQHEERPRADRRALRGRLVLREGSQQTDRATPRTVFAAIAVHLVVIAVLVRLVTLGHGLHDWFGLKPLSLTPEERVVYVETKKPEPKPPEPKPAPKPVAKAPPTAVTAAPLTPPTTVTEIPAVDPALIGLARGGDSSATGTGKPRNLGINPALIGLAPVNSDPRLWDPTGTSINIPRSQQQLLDSVVGWAIVSAADSLDSIARLYDANRAPADWTKRMKNGEKWGWDKTGLRLGKYTVPNALLALLPAGIQKGMQSNPIEAQRSRAILFAREDIARFSAQSIGEADFRKALKEVRERKDREYQARSKKRAAEKAQSAPTPPKAAGSGGD
ncbi:MAG: hypothetical protein ABI852_15015 [Gemmatimonadaceae bacterium]